MYFHLSFNVNYVHSSLSPPPFFCGSCAKILFWKPSAYHSSLHISNSNLAYFFLKNSLNRQVCDLCQLVCHLWTFSHWICAVFCPRGIFLQQFNQAGLWGLQGSILSQRCFIWRLSESLVSSTCPTIMFFTFLMVIHTLTPYCFNLKRKSLNEPIRNLTYWEESRLTRASIGFQWLPSIWSNSHYIWWMVTIHELCLGILIISNFQYK